MSANTLYARVKRVAPASLVVAVLAMSGGNALAQDPNQPPAAAQKATPAPQDAAAPKAALAPQAAQAPAPEVTGVIRRISITGTQRIEAATVLSYIVIHEGDTYNDQSGDKALKALFATGLFSDVKIAWDNGTLTIHVVENPIVNQIDFEGNSKVTTKDLEKEVQLNPRQVFTRAKVQADVQRIIELYRRNGRFAASVNPQIIQRPQNRVDLIYSITEGPTTGVSRINFVGNKAFGDDTLRAKLSTVETAWWKILTSSDNYDPDRLMFDKEQLRRFYVSKGYADFHVVSAVAELTPDHSSFYITFTVDEGKKYSFGKIEIVSKVRELPSQALRPMVDIKPGEVYDEERVSKAKDTLVNAVGTKGYATADVNLRLRRNPDNHTIDVLMNIEQGPRVYIEKINVTGNTRTLDKVIRREMRLTEGDAFNRDLVDRSRTRIRGLGFFQDVSIKNSTGSRPDRTNLTVAVTEMPTGEMSVGAGYSSTSSFVGEVAYTERNLFGRGQYLRVSVSASTISKQVQFSFTEPWFLDRPLATGFDLYKWVTDYRQADYRSDVDAISLHTAFPTSEYGSVMLRYTLRLNKVTPTSGASYTTSLYAGTKTTSELGYSFYYNTLDDMMKPTSGTFFSFTQELAGIGGNMKFLKTEGSLTGYTKLIGDDYIGSLTLSSGYIQGYGGRSVPVQERFFKGGDDFRGFKIAGIGPRDTLVSGDYGAVGGDFYAVGSGQIRLPEFLPQEYGMKFALFTDFGTLGHTSGVSRGCGSSYCIKDNLAFRASAGVTVSWKSPFGPVQISLGIPLAKAKYDKTEFIHFSAGTGF
jgi:outer membrane protein insertion porin family